MSNILADTLPIPKISFFWGILAESTREKGQRSFQVYVPDFTPLRNGDVINKGSKTASTLFDIMSQSWDTKEVKLSKTLMCEYLNVESSREVPDMYKGQQVLVVNYGCDDRWFWMPLERDDVIKPFEHVKFRCADVAVIHKSGEMDEDKARRLDLTDDNTYFMEIDTKYKKHIFFSTSGTDGEKYRYFFKIDPLEHRVEIWDGLVDTSDSKRPCLNVPHNTIKIESDPTLSQGKVLKGRITLQNEAGCTLILEDKDMKVIVPGDLSYDVKGNILMHGAGGRATTIEKDDNHIVGGTVLHHYKGNYAEQVDKSYTRYVQENRTETIMGNYQRTTGGTVTETCYARDEAVDTTARVTTGTSHTTISPKMVMTGSTIQITSDKSFTVMANNFVLQSQSLSIGGSQVSFGGGNSVNLNASNITIRSQHFENIHDPV